MKKNSKFVIHGLAGQKNLKGKVVINGAKNSALKAMAASILFDGPVTLQNVPNTDDIQTLIKILEKMGAKISVKQAESIGGNIVEIDTSKITSTDIDSGLAKNMRASVVLTGPLLSRFGKTSFPAPGGCVIGARPIDLFLSAYESMGAIVNEDEHCLYTISKKGYLKGSQITFSKISVGATETIMMAAVLGQGKTTLNNCAIEPEIANVAEWLNASGANIKGIGTSCLEIEGTSGKLLCPKSSFITIPDRIEAGSFLILGALCAKELVIEKCEPKHLEITISLLKEFGTNIIVLKDSIIVSAGEYGHSKELIRKNISTQEFPGFPTDLQAPLVVFLTQMKGEFIVHESIFEGRFKYVEDLKNIGANISVINSNEIKIISPTTLGNASFKKEIVAHDIRAGFALVLATLIGNGSFTINNVHLIDRGYEKLEERLKSLGVDIVRV